MIKEGIVDKEKITLRNVQVVFANLEDEGFGKSITIDATPEEVKKAIVTWVTDNKIGKNENTGKANFKEYEGKTQYSFKISDYTQFAGLNGLTKENLGFGSTVSLVANAFVYDNKFGKGVSGSLSAVLVEKRASTGADADLADLMGSAEPEITDIGEPVDISDIPF